MIFPSLKATSFCREAVRHSRIPVFFPVANSCRISGKDTVARFPDKLIGPIHSGRFFRFPGINCLSHTIGGRSTFLKVEDVPGRYFSHISPDTERPILASPAFDRSIRYSGSSDMAEPSNPSAESATNGLIPAAITTSTPER